MGAPADLYDDPANTFVAGFIGSPAMNFQNATFGPGDGGGRVAVRVGDASLGPVPLPAGGSPDATVTVGLRPERIRIGPAETGAPAFVDLVEPTGLGLAVHLMLGGQPLKAFTTERLSLAAVERVGLSIDPANLLLFDPATGVRLRG